MRHVRSTAEAGAGYVPSVLNKDGGAGLLGPEGLRGRVQVGNRLLVGRAFDIRPPPALDHTPLCSPLYGGV